MKIAVLEERITELKNPVIYSILELIISAVRDYPLSGLNDTTTYFNQVMELLKTDKITFELVINYMDSIRDDDDEKNAWISTSLTSLLEALDLMKSNNISFEEIKKEIQYLNKN